MRPLEKSSLNLSHARAQGTLALEIANSGRGMSDWATEARIGVSEVYDAVLVELANDSALRQQVLNKVDISVVRVFADTGDAAFDRFATTAISLQVLARGLDKKDVLERLSIELLDSFLTLRQQGRITRFWLARLLSEKYQDGRKVYRYGELVRAALLVSSLTGWHEDDPLFLWAVENQIGIAGCPVRQWSRYMSAALEDVGYPSFDLWKVIQHGNEAVVRVDFDTSSLFCRRLLRAMIDDMPDWGDARHLMSPFFREFTQSLGFTPSSLEDFSGETFARQMDWFCTRRGLGDSTYEMLHRFYRLVGGLLSDAQNPSGAGGVPPC